MIGQCIHCSNKPMSQDKLHGAGRRVLNPTKKSDPKTGKPIYRCTQCGRET